MALETATEAATLIRVTLSGALVGVCEIALSAPMTAQFASLLTGEPPEPGDEISDELREAAAELMQQICGNAADRLRQVFGALELKAQPAERDPESGARQLFQISRDNDALEFELHILSLALRVEPAAAALARPDAATAPPPITAPAESFATKSASQTAKQQATLPATQPATQFATQPATQATSQPSAQLANHSSHRNLDLLLDIELGVTLRFGSRQMLLKDILELCSGSVVELDRRVEEPVDLLIDGRLIAQGEVVIVGGNYGLRVLQVATQYEKMACLP
jgi:flagellar motor switch protein FliN